MSRTMTLRSRCGRCDRPVELAFSPWAGSGPAVAAEWTCPACQMSNHLPAIGQVAWVDLSDETPRAADPPKPARAR